MAEEEQYIQFISNYKDWVSVKKLRITEQTDPKTVMEFLASLTMSVDSKVEANLAKVVELGKLDSALKEVLQGAGKKEKEIAAILSAVASSKVNKAITEITEKASGEKGVRKELQGFCKAYSMRKALKECGLAIDYSGIEIPGMKRVMKKKSTG